MTHELLEWFAKHKRDLPWRHTKNPYQIWLSEIILQQTQVVQGLSYYHKFCENYPTITDLANASEEEVMKLWQGLGYYSRARNLHRTAKIITEKYAGVFPNNYVEIRALPGVGDYTAAAIASFAFDLCYPVLDGNVARVISRMFGVFSPIDTSGGKIALMNILEKNIDKNEPSTFNQAIMEFGAIHCKPRQPLCETCVFQRDCYAFKQAVVDVLPMKKNKTVVVNRPLNYLICIEHGCVWIKKRIHRDIWQHLYDFPEVDEKIAEQFTAKQRLSQCEHQLSHQRLKISFWNVKKLPNQSKIDAQKIPLSEFYRYAIPKPIHNFVAENELFTNCVDKKVPNVKKI